MISLDIAEIEFLPTNIDHQNTPKLAALNSILLSKQSTNPIPGKLLLKSNRAQVLFQTKIG